MIKENNTLQISELKRPIITCKRIVRQNGITIRESYRKEKRQALKERRV